MSIYGTLLEKVTVTKIKPNKFDTNLKFRGLKIELRTYNSTTEEEMIEMAERCEANFKAFKSNYDRLEKEEFTKLLSSCEDWEMDNIKNVSQLMKMVTLDHIIYRKDDRFECWYNAFGKSDDFFGNHSFIINVEVEGKTAKVTSADLEG